MVSPSVKWAQKSEKGCHGGDQKDQEPLCAQSVTLLYCQSPSLGQGLRQVRGIGMEPHPKELALDPYKAYLGLKTR